MPQYGAWFKMPDGTVAHVCGGKKFPVCSCGFWATLQCDYLIGKRGKTCDANICEECATEVGEDRHHCKAHRDQPVQEELL